VLLKINMPPPKYGDTMWGGFHTRVNGWLKRSRGDGPGGLGGGPDPHLGHIRKQKTGALKSKRGFGKKKKSSGESRGTKPQKKKMAKLSWEKGLLSRTSCARVKKNPAVRRKAKWDT